MYQALFFGRSNYISETIDGGFRNMYRRTTKITAIIQKMLRTIEVIRSKIQTIRADSMRMRCLKFRRSFLDTPKKTRNTVPDEPSCSYFSGDLSIICL